MIVPVNEPLLNGNEKKYLNECIDTGYVSSEGPFVKRFEKSMADYIGRKHAIAVTNGTVAIDVAIEALGLEKGDEVIMPTFTIISCISGLIRKGCKPVFVDQNPDTWNMDVTQIEAKITPRTKAIMVVHIYGLPVDMNQVIQLSEKYKLKVIEDAAEMHGQEYIGRKCGSFGDISTVSFYPNKLITTGEGGMVFTDNDMLAERCRSIRNLCFIPEQRFIHNDLGFKLYQEKLGRISSIQLPLVETAYAKNIYWVFGIVIRSDFDFDAKRVSDRLAKWGIGTRPFFWSLHEQPVLHKLGYKSEESFPVSERLSRRGLYIPSGLALTIEQIDYVSAKLAEIFN